MSESVELTQEIFDSFMAASQLNQAAAANNQPVDPSPLLAPLVSSFTLRLLDCWCGQPEAWFSKVESQFLDCHPPFTADSTKFNKVIGSLS